MKLVDPNTSLEQHLRAHPEWAPLFSHLGIDLRCDRNWSLAEICQAHQLEPQSVARMLGAFAKQLLPTPAAATKLMLLPELCDYLEQSHHAQLHDEFDELDRMTLIAAKQKGEANPQLLIIRDAVASLRAQLNVHLCAEADDLFPLIRQLANDDHGEWPTRSELEFHVVRMEYEHNQLDEALAELSRLVANESLRLQFPSVARRLAAAIARFDHSVRALIYHENQELFPRALARKFSA